MDGEVRQSRHIKVKPSIKERGKSKITRPVAAGLVLCNKTQLKKEVENDC